RAVDVLRLGRLVVVVTVRPHARLAVAVQPSAFLVLPTELGLCLLFATARAAFHSSLIQKGCGALTERCRHDFGDVRARLRHYDAVAVDDARAAGALVVALAGCAGEAREGDRNTRRTELRDAL